MGCFTQICHRAAEVRVLPALPRRHHDEPTSLRRDRCGLRARDCERQHPRALHLEHQLERVHGSDPGARALAGTSQLWGQQVMLRSHSALQKSPHVLANILRFSFLCIYSLDLGFIRIYIQSLYCSALSPG
jgi:hypothetical protein